MVLSEEETVCYVLLSTLLSFVFKQSCQHLAFQLVPQYTGSQLTHVI